MALNKVSRSTLRNLAANLSRAAKNLKLMIQAMPAEQPELLCELATRVDWAKGFRTWSAKLKEEQPLQLQMLKDGIDLDEQKAMRQGAHRKKKPPEGEEPKKSRGRKT